VFGERKEDVQYTVRKGAYAVILHPEDKKSLLSKHQRDIFCLAAALREMKALRSV